MYAVLKKTRRGRWCLELELQPIVSNWESKELGSNLGPLQLLLTSSHVSIPDETFCSILSRDVMKVPAVDRRGDWLVHLVGCGQQGRV